MTHESQNLEYKRSAMRNPSLILLYVRGLLRLFLAKCVVLDG